MYEIDNSLALVSLDDAARLLRLGNNVTGLRLKLADPYSAPLTVRDVSNAIGGGLYIDDWTREHANFFRSIELTKRMLFFILLLVVAVAAFNIVSTLVMAVKDKRPDIAILRTLGARPAQHPGNIRDAGHRHRACRHARGRGARPADRGQSRSRSCTVSKPCSASSFSMRAYT